MSVSPDRPPPAPPSDARRHRGSHRGHGWMMLACCAPMLAIAGLLVLTGVASAGLLLAAVACTVMMSLMMGAMAGAGHGHEERHAGTPGREPVPPTTPPAPPASPDTPTTLPPPGRRDARGR